MKKLLVLLLCVGLLGCSSNNNQQEEGNTLVVGMECAYAPFNWTQVDDNGFGVKINDVDYCDGYDVQMAKEIATQLNKELVIKKTGWDGLIPAVKNDQIDLIIAGMTQTPDRSEQIDFTDVYYSSEMVMIVKKDSNFTNATSIQDFANAKVMGQQATIYDEVIDQIENVNHMTPQADYPMMVMSLLSGQTDALTAELPVAVGVTKANPELTYITFTEGNGFVADTTVSIGLKKDSELTDAINKALETISTETRNQMMIDATDRQPAAK